MTDTDYRAVYQATIPRHCALQTAEAHMDLLGLCWGVVSDVQKKIVRDVDNCGYCEYNTNYTDEGRREFFAKERTWEILNET